MASALPIFHFDFSFLFGAVQGRVNSQKMPCPRWGSNSRPSDYETDALPTALRRLFIIYCQIFPTHINVCTQISPSQKIFIQQLSFLQKFCPRWGSNSRPSDYETDALPTALRRHYNGFLKTFPCEKNVCTHGGTRTPNLRFRRPTPYPLGHAGTCYKMGSNGKRTRAKQTSKICASPGNRTRVTRMGILHDTITPTALRCFKAEK